MSLSLSAVVKGLVVTAQVIKKNLLPDGPKSRFPDSSR